MKLSALFFAIGQASLWLAAGQDALWNQAVRSVSVGSKVPPGLLHETETTRDLKQRVQEQTERKISLSWSVTGPPQPALIEAWENGKDVTTLSKERWQRGEKERFLHDFAAAEEALPFQAARQDRITVTPGREERRIGGRRCLAYDYVLRAPQGTWSGRAWIDRDAGIPREVSATCDPPPLVEKGMETLSYRILFRYKEGPDGGGRLAEYTTVIQLRAKRFLIVLFEGTTQNTIRFSDRPVAP